MHTPTRFALAAALALAIAGIGAVPAGAAPSLTTYSNCSAVHRVYSGGIAKKGVRYNITRYRGVTHHRALHGHVKFSTALYNANRRLDRDRDGIACEKA